MKKRVVLAVICMTFAVAACGKTTVNDAEVTQEQSQEQSEEPSDVEASEDADSSAEEDSVSSNPAEDTALSESVSYSVCTKEVKSEEGTDLFYGEYIQLMSTDSSLESVISKINNDIEKDNLEKIEEYSTFAQDDSENIINSGMPYYLKPTEVFTEKNDDKILSIGIMREGYAGGSMNNMIDFYNINLAECMLINMDQLISVSDENAKKIVEGLSTAYFDGNMSKEYQAEAVDAFNNGQTQFSIQDDGSIKIYFYQDTVNIPVSWAAVCVEVDSEGNIIRVFE